MEKVKITNGTITFSILFIALLAVAYFSRYILITSLIGIGIGTLISPLLNKLRSKLHLPRSLSALIVFLGIIIVLSGVMGSIYFLVAGQVQSLTEKSPEIYNSLNQWVAGTFDRYPWLREQAQEIDVGQTAQRSLINVFRGFRLGLVAISGAVFALVIGLYTALNSREYFSSTVEAFAPRLRPQAHSVLKECGSVLQGWFKAQLTDMLIIGTLTGLGLWICKIEYWAVFGLLTAVMGIIPYVGIMLVVAATSIITLASDPGQLPWVLLVFGITQQLEGNVILPMVMKGQVELPVVPLLIFMLLLGTFFGILGVFIAPPLFAILRTVYIRVYLPFISRGGTSQQSLSI